MECMNTNLWSLVESSPFSFVSSAGIRVVFPKAKQVSVFCRVLHSQMLSTLSQLKGWGSEIGETGVWADWPSSRTWGRSGFLPYRLALSSLLSHSFSHTLLMASQAFRNPFCNHSWRLYRRWWILRAGTFLLLFRVQEFYWHADRGRTVLLRWWWAWWVNWGSVLKLNLGLVHLISSSGPTTLGKTSALEDSELEL